MEARKILGVTLEGRYSNLQQIDKKTWKRPVNDYFE